MKIKLLFLYALMSCFILAGTSRAQDSVIDDVKKTVDEVVRIVSDKELKKNQNEKKKRAALKAAIGAIFDYGEMTKRAMGAHWKGITAEEKKEITGLFETLLENSYAKKIESYNNEKVVYLRENVDHDYAEVKSKIITAKHDEYAVDYRLMNEGGKWRVYDVVIEGVSLVSNYRSQFNRIINDKGFKELVKRLQSKSKEIKDL